MRAEARAQMEAELRKIQESERETRETEITRAREEADAQTRDIVRDLKDQARMAKAEAEAQAASERLAREEIEARAQAQVREAQAQMREVQAQSARVQAESAAQTENERKARLEAEARADNERNSREEAVNQARAEAEQKARVEVELLMAAEKKARAEADAKANQERQLRDQAERKAMQELALKIAAERKAREQVEQQAAVARQAREEAERRLSITAAGDPEKLRIATEQAQAAARVADEAVARATAMAEAATRAKAEAEARVKTEQVARAAAEDRAKAEAVQRVVQEQQSRERAETDIAARVARELKAREDAERAEDAKYRAEAEERARKSSTERQARDASAKAAEPVRGPARKKNLLVLGVGGAVVMVAATLGLLHVLPLSGYIPGVQNAMSKRLGQPVAISNMRYELFPSAQLLLEKVSVGKLQDVKADVIYVPIGPVGLISGTSSFDTIDVKGVTLDADTMGLIAGWVRAQTGEPALQINHIKLRGVKLSTRALEIPPFEVNATLGTRGELQKATINVDKARFEVTPKDKVWRVALNASGWKSLIGPAVEFEDLDATAIVDASGATITDIKGRVGGGALTGQLKANWSGTLQVSGDLKLENGRLNQLMPFFTKNFSSSGTLNLTANYSMSGATLKTLFDDVRLEGPFTIAGGELNNVDIVRALQSARAGGQRGGKTRFENLAGTVQVSGNSYSYRQLQLSSGPMNASGAVDVNDGALSGRINAELGTKGVVVARGALTPGGTLRDPVLR